MCAAARLHRRPNCSGMGSCQVALVGHRLGRPCLHEARRDAGTSALACSLKPPSSMKFMACCDLFCPASGAAEARHGMQEHVSSMHNRCSRHSSAKGGSSQVGCGAILCAFGPLHFEDSTPMVQPAHCCAPHLGRSRRTCGWQTRTRRSRWAPDLWACRAGSARTPGPGWASIAYQTGRACCRCLSGSHPAALGLRMCAAKECIFWRNKERCASQLHQLSSAVGRRNDGWGSAATATCRQHNQPATAMARCLPCWCHRRTSRI